MYYPKISIVTPSYNQGQFIEQTISSVLDQNYPNLEYIIIDGGSNDNTISIIKRYEPYLTYWVSEKDSGQSNAINKGLTKSTGEIFNWLNSDDYLEKGSLFQIGEIFTNERITMLSGRCRKFGIDMPDTIVPSDHQAFDLDNMLFKMQYMQPSTFIRSSVVKKMGMLTEQLKYCMDYDWMIRYFLCQGTSEVLEVDTILSHARLHDASKTSMQTNEFFIETIALYYNLAINLGLDKSIIEKYASYKKTPKYEFTLNLQQNLNASIIEKQLWDYITPFLNDPSYIFRKTTDYYAAFNQHKSALDFSIKAVKANPLKLLNYKYMIHAMLKSYNL
jgi:glycosyltransferase involved in cell wall biosynthesis